MNAIAWSLVALSLAIADAAYTIKGLGGTPESRSIGVAWLIAVGFVFICTVLP